MFPQIERRIGKTRFYALTKTSLQNNGLYSAWERPEGVSMLMGLMIGGGGAGGNGFTRAAGNPGGGGGGGASGAIVRFIMPLMDLERFYYSVGAGGTSTRPQGQPCFISMTPTVSSNANDLLVATSSAGAGWGGNGTAAAGGAAGTSPGAGSIAANLWGLYMQAVFVSGQAGATGGAVGTAGASVAANTIGAVNTPGGGGGGCNNGVIAPGGAVALTNGYISTQPGVGGSSAINTPGSNGFNLYKPFFSFGGGGGCGCDVIDGGAGGNGGYGSGGGGGGAGVNGGIGGSGGDGIIFLWAW